METTLNFLMSTNGLILIGILWYLVQHFLGVKSRNKSQLEKWLMSQFIGAIAQQEVEKLGIIMPGTKSESDKNRDRSDMARTKAIDKVINVALASNKKKALKEIGIELTHKAAGMAIDRIIKTSKMGIKLKIRDLPFLKAIKWPRI